MIYNSLILSLHYGIALWGKSPGNLTKIQKKQFDPLLDRANSHTIPLLKILETLSIANIFTVKLLCLYKQIKDNKTPRSITNLFEPDELSIPVPKPPIIKTFGITIRFELPNVLINVHAELLNISCTYPRNIKKFIIGRYSSLCTETGCRACNLENNH